MSQEKIRAFNVFVFNEVVRASRNFPDQEETLTLAEWLAVLTEEVGEVARVINDAYRGDTYQLAELEHMAEELVQVGAMAARMFSAARKHLVAPGPGRK